MRSLREVVEAIYDAANRRDLDEMLELLHPDVVWWTPTSRLRGHAAVRGFLAGWQVSFRPQFTAERFIEVEDALAVMVRVDYPDREGAEVGHPLHVWEMDGDRVTRVQVYPDRDEGLAALRIAR